MKKKRNLGITLTALFMVIALALTGCGQKDEQNAGATGSGDGNGSTVSEPAKEPERGGETNEPADEVDNRHPEMKDGYYVYNVLGEEFLCKTNVWDYIDEDAGTFDFGGMKDDLCLGVRDGNYFIGDRALRTPSLIAGDISEVNYDILTFTDGSHTKVDQSQEVLYRIKYSTSTAASREYVSKNDSNYGFTFDLIILITYGCEQLKDDLSVLPLNGHLVEYYNPQTMTYELP